MRRLRDDRTVSFTFSYSTAASDTVGRGRGGLAPNTTRVVFLKKTATGYAFVSPITVRPALPNLAPNWQVQLGEDAYHKVLQRLSNLLCTDFHPQRKQRLYLT